MDRFELISEYKPTGDHPRPLKPWSKVSRKETSARPFWVSLVQEKPLRWQMSSQNGINRR